jgi:hypothetical protein
MFMSYDGGNGNKIRKEATPPQAPASVALCGRPPGRRGASSRVRTCGGPTARHPPHPARRTPHTARTPPQKRFIQAFATASSSMYVVQKKGMVKEGLRSGAYCILYCFKLYMWPLASARTPAPVRLYTAYDAATAKNG